MGAIRAALLDAVVAALPVALVYFAGWAYLSSYLDAFGIDYTQVNIPLTTVLVYAFTPLSNVWLLFATAFLIGGWQLLALIPKCRKFQGRVAVSFSAIILVVAMLTIKYVAAFEANVRVADVWLGRKSISQVVLSRSDAAEVGYSKYAECRASDSNRQILALPEQTFLLCLNKKWPDNAILFVVKGDGTISYFAGRQAKHE
ncbi:hypothetical protein [Rhizobium sp. SL86]|uniref:hypothetical protein n=1 Tax=Rhizobium sp. SL86 TaxID=2995148 RepID=UPI002273042F|nr:hypothetical protein [Rhizobium sp. SL86]MCY1667032.1 hypothetical protein [Rhizobium sp. SL86]